VISILVFLSFNPAKLASALDQQLPILRLVADPVNRNIHEAVRGFDLTIFDCYALNLVGVCKPSKQLNQFSFRNRHLFVPFFLRRGGETASPALGFT
jgi:hypothetical protein